MNSDIRLLKKIVSSYSPYSNEQNVAKIILSEMRNREFKSSFDQAGNVMGEIGSGKKTILFVGHMDVYQGKIPVKIKNNHLYGRGSVDAKGCIAAIICGASQLDKKVLKNKKIIIASCVEEEGPSSKGARYLIKNNKYRPDYLIIGEPSGWDHITIGYKGILSFEVNFSQDNFHYGSAGKRVINMAIHFCKDLIDKIESEKGKRRFDSPSVEIRNFCSKNDGITENCCLNIVIRIPPNYDISNLRDWLRKKLNNKKIKLMFSQTDPAVLSEINSKLVKSFRRIIKKEGGKATLVKKLGTSDMNILDPFYKVPSIAYGPGDSKLDHTPHEHLDLDEYKKSIEIWKKVLMLL